MNLILGSAYVIICNYMLWKRLFHYDKSSETNKTAKYYN